jgi:hypothetical protein
MPELGLAKSAPQPTMIVSTEPINQEQVVPSWNGVPMSVFKFLNIDFFDSSDKNIEELKDIYQYARSRSNGMDGDIIQRIDELKNRLGEPEIGTTRLAQLSNYVRLNRQISDLMKQKRVLEKKWA